MRSLLCKLGYHTRVVQGGGMMSDCLLCIDCGREKYPEVFPGLVAKVRPHPVDPTTGLLIKDLDRLRSLWERDHARDNKMLGHVVKFLAFSLLGAITLLAWLWQAGVR